VSSVILADRCPSIRDRANTFTPELMAMDAHVWRRSCLCRVRRKHDLRHSFAVHAMLEAYAAGQDGQARLTLLSTYLGHVHPASTYWYLSASPELMSVAGQRLETHLAGRS
jgi:integrase